MNKETIPQIKVVLLGDSGVGKTSIAQRFVSNKFDPSSRPTRVAGLVTKSLEIPEMNKTVRFQIWDTAGQEKYQSMVSTYYKDAAAAILVFDLTNLSTFQNLEKWLKELKDKGPANILTVLVANKSDLVMKQKVELEDAENLAEKYRSPLLIVSAKDNMHIQDIFIRIALNLIGPSQEDIAKVPSKDSKGNVVLDKDSNKEKKGDKCC